MLEHLNISWDNLFLENFNALSFSLLGITIVFCGLALISLIIAVLPKALALVEKDYSKKDANKGMVNADPKDLENSEEELMIAIALAIHMDQSFSEENQKFTWDTSVPHDPSWKNAMHADVLSSRQNIPLRRL